MDVESFMVVVVECVVGGDDIVSMLKWMWCGAWYYMLGRYYSS